MMVAVGMKKLGEIQCLFSESSQDEKRDPEQMPTMKHWSKSCKQMWCKGNCRAATWSVWRNQEMALKKQ